MDINREDQILRWLRGECTDSETEELRKWAAASEANRRMLDDLQRIHAAAPYLRGLGRFRKADALSRVKPVARKPRRTLMRMMRYAAVAVVAVTCGWFGYRALAPHGEALQYEFTPGEKKAILSFSDGSSVTIGESGERTFSDPVTGRTVTLAEDDLLDYSDSGDGQTTPATHRITIPRGGEFKLRLPDGSQVWLNSGTTLEYPTAFGEGNREVALSGEAFFEVESDAASPFRVTMGQTVIEVTGTSFNASCYPEDKIFDAVLESGRISFRADGRTVEVEPGQRALYDPAKGGISVENVDLKYYSAWRDGTFYFYDTPLTEIMAKLGRWYDVEFVYDPAAIEGLRFSGVAYRDRPLDDMIEVLESIQVVRFDRKEGRRVGVAPF